MQHAARLPLILGALALGCGDAYPLWTPEEKPAPPRASTRVFSGRAAMLFDGPSCTREGKTEADRYCAFVAAGINGARSLYVLNVSAVLHGTPVTCDAPDPHCT